MIEDFLVPFLVVGLAELGDKTQLSVILLSSKVKNHFRLLLGVILAFMVVDGVAVLFGSWITNLLSPESISIVSGIVFIVFGLIILRTKVDDTGESKFSGSAFASGFILIFLTEWGDKTQIAAALFASKYAPVLVFLATVASMALLSALAIYVGRALAHRIDRRLLTKVSGLLFIALGVVSLLG